MALFKSNSVVIFLGKFLTKIFVILPKSFPSRAKKEICMNQVYLQHHGFRSSTQLDLFRINFSVRRFKQ